MIFFWHVFVSSSNCAFFFFSCILSRQCLKYAMFWSFSVENPWMRFVALSGTLKNCPNSRDCCSIWNCRPPCPLFQIHYDSKQLFLKVYLKGHDDNCCTIFRPLNPLGSRFEIQLTITWIKTHLEEDQQVSLPKHEVYDDYL